MLPQIADNPVQLGVLAQWAAFFGDDGLALELLTRMTARGSLVVLLWRPVFAHTRTTPGFKDLARRLRLVEYWRSSGQWSEFCHPLASEDFECR